MEEDVNRKEIIQFGEKIEEILYSEICEEISFIRYIIKKKEIKNLLLNWPLEIKIKLIEEFNKLENN